MDKIDHFRIIILFVFFGVSLPKAEAQFEVFLDFLIYDYGLLFGFEDEPGVFDIDFAPYPYEMDYHGLYLLPDEVGHRVNTYVNFHFQNNEDDLSGGFFQIKFSPVSVFTIDVNHLQLFKNNTRDPDERYSFTNYSAIFNRIRNPRVHFWWDIGLTRAGGKSQDTEWGPSLGGGATFYIKKPISIYTDFRWTYFVENLYTTGFYQARLQAHMKQFLIYAGLHFVDGDFNWTSWSLGTGVYF